MYNKLSNQIKLKKIENASDENQKYHHLIKLKDSYLEKIGWIRSIQDNACVDSDGNPIPWISYPAYHFLEQRLPRELTVFEYGTGNSTLWFSTRAAHVYSVDHDLEWHEKIKEKISNANVTCLYEKLEYGGKYGKKVLEIDKLFDIIMIDGRDRVNCIYNSVNKLKNDGIIILDNSDRDAYAPGMDFLKNREFRRIDFTGFAPLSYWKIMTTIFYRKFNILDI